MKLGLSGKAYILIAIPLLFELVFVFVLVYTQIQLEGAYEREMKARQIVSEVNNALVTILKSTSSLMIHQLTGEKEHLYESHSGFESLRKNRLNLKGIKLDGTLGSDVDKFASTFESLAQDFESFRKASGKEKKLLLMPLDMKAREMMTSAEQSLEKFVIIQEKGQEDQRRYRKALYVLVTIGVVINVLLGIILAAFFNRSATRRLAVLQENSHRLAEGKALLPEIKGSDEIKELDDVFHSMAATIAKATKREKAIITNTADLIFSLDSALEIRFISKACIKFLGFDPDGLVGNEIDEIVVDEDLATIRTKLIELLKSDESISLECKMLDTGGNSIDTLWSAYWSDEEDLIFCVAHDVSKQKELERNRQQFVSMVSHDLKSPLTTLNLTFNLLSEGSLGALNNRGEQLVNSGSEIIRRLRSLISDLLDSDRLEQGQMEIASEEVLVEELKSESIKSVQNLMDKKGITIDCHCPNMSIKCDKQRIVQVLINLLSNAIKFSRENSKIALMFKNEESSTLIEVIDQGRGIPKDKIKVVFDRYKQTSTEDSSEYDGSGLGLFICKELVDAHNGEIGVESREGSGSRFWIKLPK